MNTRTGVAILALLAAGALRAPRAEGEEKPKPEPEPIAIQVYYSKDDPNWKKAEETIDAAVKPYADRVAVEKISIDEKEGYAKLREVEKAHKGEETGEITVVIGSLMLTSKGKRRGVEDKLGELLRRAFDEPGNKGRLPADAAAFAREVLGRKDLELTQILDSDTDRVYEVRAGGKTVAWVIDAYRAIHCPICNDAQLLVLTSNDEVPAVKTIKPVRALELYGNPMSKERTDQLLKQFIGRTLKKDAQVDVISGATKTTHAYEQGVVGALERVDQLRGKP